MELTIKGRFRKKELLEQFIQYTCKKILHPNTYENLDVEVVYRKNGPNEEKAMADCSPVDGERRPRSFEIMVYHQPKHFYNFLCLLAHEIWHIKQWATCKLRSDETFFYFNDKRVSDKKSYWEYPHELEARAWEIALAEAWWKQYATENNIKIRPRWMQQTHFS